MSGGQNARSRIATPDSRPPDSNCLSLHAPLLRRAAAVVRQRGDVLDAGDLQAGVLELDDRLLAAGAGALHLDLDLDHAALAGRAGRRSRRRGRRRTGCSCGRP